MDRQYTQENLRLSARAQQTADTAGPTQPGKSLNPEETWKNVQKDDA